MKFNLINQSMVFGGQERYVQELGKWLVAKGHQISFKGLPGNLLLSNALPEECGVHLYNGNSALYSTLKGGVSGALNVYVHHSHIDDGQQLFWRRWVRKALLKLLLRRFDLVVRVCNVALPDFYAPNRIITIYNGVALDDSVLPRGPRHIKKWLMVGGVTNNKNQRLAIAALAHCQDATLTIVGSGPALESLQLYASNLNVDSRVEWVGFVADPQPYFNVCDVLLMLSHFEAFPYVVLEAMASGMPVIATPVGGVPEVITDKNGILLNDYTIKSLVDAVMQLEKAPDLYAGLSSAAISTIKERFTLECCYRRLVSEIEKAIKDKELR